MAKVKSSELGRYRKTISRNVRRIRGEMGLNEFALKAGLSISTVHRIESCRSFNADSLLRIALAFGVRPYELCLSDDERNRHALGLDALADAFKELIKKEIVEELKKGQIEG